jgi:hypothetical protein
MRFLITLILILSVVSGFAQDGKSNSGSALLPGLEPTDSNSSSSGKATQEESDLPYTKSDDSPVGFGFSVGAVTLDNKIHTQISFMPEITVGKFGMALDLRIFIDENGDIRTDNWDSAEDIYEKFYYVRWAHKGDPFYVRAGAINNYRLGYGILMNKYYNTIQYPTIIRTGLMIGIETGKLTVDLMMNDFKELGRRQGGVFAGRVGFRPIGDLEIGASVVYDRNQYAVLRDRDRDNIPDALDDFPDQAGTGREAVDSDGDGVPDAFDPDRDGNGYTDNSQNPFIQNNDIFFDPSGLKPDPFSVDSAPDRDQIAFAADIGYPFVKTKTFELLGYAQAAKFGFGGGWGYTVPGILGKVAFINFFAEYRIMEAKFIPEYFSTTYELDRVVIQDSTGNGDLYPITKRDQLHMIDSRLQGYVAGADFNLWDVVIFGADYQRLKRTSPSATPGATDMVNTLRLDLNLNTSFVPKFKKAGAYFYQQNADDLFTKTEGTVLGARLHYEISPGAAIVLDYRENYKDLNGDGQISGPDETVKTTNIQTVFAF